MVETETELVFRMLGGMRLGFQEGWLVLELQVRLSLYLLAMFIVHHCNFYNRETVLQPSHFLTH